MKSSFKTIFALLITLIITPSALVFAQNTYTTTQDGLWSVKATWVAENIAPNNINNNDVVEINHNVSAGNMKINNGGTILITAGGILTGDNLVMNGKSELIVKVGANVEFKNFSYNNINGTQDATFSEAIVTPLPVTLIFFDVKRNAQQTSTILEWITASEKNNAYFAVEKSLNGKEFSEAGRVIGKNTVTGGKYSFEDKQVTGRAYYRLKQVDLDGTFTYSAIVVASANHKTAVLGREVVFNQAFTGKLRIVNLAGSVVKTFQLTNSYTFGLPEELKGIYLLQLENGTQVISQKIGL